MLQQLLIKTDCRNIPVQRNDILTILDKQLVPGIDLGGLVDEHFLNVL